MNSIFSVMEKILLTSLNPFHTRSDYFAKICGKMPKYKQRYASLEDGRIFLSLFAKKLQNKTNASMINSLDDALLKLSDFDVLGVQISNLGSYYLFNNNEIIYSDLILPLMEIGKMEGVNVFAIFDRLKTVEIANERDFPALLSGMSINHTISDYERIADRYRFRKE